MGCFPVCRGPKREQFSTGQKSFLQMGSNGWQMRSNLTVQPLLSENADEGIAVSDEKVSEHSTL